MFIEMDELDGQQLFDDSQESIYESSIAVHDSMIIGSFQRIINKVIDERLEVMYECGIKPTKYFYEDIKGEIKDLLCDSINNFFDNNGD